MNRRGTRHLTAPVAALAAAALLLTGCGSDGDGDGDGDDPTAPPTSSGAPPASSAPSDSSGTDQTAAPVTDPSSLLDYLEQNQDQTGLVVLREGESEPVVSTSADELMPLASVRKVLILMAAAEGVVGGMLDPAEPVAVADVERWYAPGTDAGAHEAAVTELGASWTVQTAMQAMIMYSDNAATDWLLDRVGGTPTIDRVADAFGMTAQEPVWPGLGEVLAWDLEARCLARRDTGRAGRDREPAHGGAPGRPGRDCPSRGAGAA